MINKRIKVQKMKTIVLFAVLLPLCFASCAKKKSCCQAGFVHDLCATDSYPRCYCDNACLLHGDCCGDYKKYCLQSQPEPCIYTEWGSWGPCSTSHDCDVGFTTRYRDVKQFGNFKTSRKCRQSDLVERKACGDMNCFRYNMSLVYDIAAYFEDINHYYYSTALYQYVKGSGNCKSFTPRYTFACIMCPDDSKCGDYVLKKKDEIDIDYEQCTGTWVKRTKSHFRTQCMRRALENVYAFNL